MTHSLGIKGGMELSLHSMELKKGERIALHLDSVPETLYCKVVHIYGNGMYSLDFISYEEYIQRKTTSL